MHPHLRAGKCTRPIQERLKSMTGIECILIAESRHNKRIFAKNARFSAPDFLIEFCEMIAPDETLITKRLRMKGAYD